jgi:hypothetical protein
MLAAGISYAVGLMIAFALLTGPFLPLAAQTLFSMTIAGAVLCFAFSVIYNGTRGGIELHKTKATINEINEDRLQKIAAFMALKASSSEDDQKAQKLLFLEVKKLMAETTYQEKMITYQSVSLMRSIIVESLIPAVVLLSLLFLPLGPGLGILAAAIALAVASHYIINAVFKPEKEALKEFDEQEYKEFCQDPHNWGKKPSTKTGSFFKAADTTVGKIEVPESDEEEEDPDVSETRRLLEPSSSASSLS